MTANPPVEMLWESTDAGEVLRDRFGFERSDAVADWVGNVLASEYRISVQDLDRVVLSDANALAWVSSDQGPLIVKWSVAPERFARLSAISELTAWLFDREHPVSAPYPTVSGAVHIEQDGVSLSVQRVMPGSHLPTDDPRLVRAAGGTLARLHLDLAQYQAPHELTDSQVGATSMRALIESWLEQKPEHIRPEAAQRLSCLIKQTSTDGMDQQLVHGDFRSANVLVAENRVTAVLDFEELRIDFPIAELARSAVMLGTLFRDWGPVSSSVHEGLREGYEMARPLSSSELSWWRPLVLWWSMLMVPQSNDATGWGAALDTLME